MRARTLDRGFFERDDVTRVARELIGKFLVSESEDTRCVGMITETEAYAGRTDRACHAYGGRRTERTEVMYGRGGTAYVYLCYGIHHLLNVISAPEGTPDAVLIRAIEATDGVDQMLERRGMEKPSRNWLGGPGKLTQGLAVRTKEHNRSDLTGKGPVRIEDRGVRIPPETIREGERIGIDYAGPDAKLPYRFYITEKEGKRILEKDR